MRISLDPMTILRTNAETRIEGHFAGLANGHKDVAHRMKREAAERIIEGGKVPSWFADEAALSGYSVETLAHVIIAKPDELVERELLRRRALLAVRAAVTPAEISQVVDSLLTC